MLLKTLLIRMDHFICSYLGLDRDTARTREVKLVDGSLMILYNSPYKRHVAKARWCEFAKEDPANLEKLAGKALASNLVISFKEPVIRKTPDA